ncbi:MAG: FtsX-like permease family protein, partial [Clostridiales bacterium]|nr:FtsX-like permease family protein [Clostridiales bacterium]
MRNPLNKRIPRDFKKNFLKYAGMIIILICTIAVGSSFQSTLNSAKEYLDKIKDNNLQEDGFIEVANSLSSDIIKHLDSMGIEAHENFYVTENEFTDDSKVLLFNERKGIDLPTVFEGELPKNDSEIAIDHVFARNRGISIGDTISLLGRDYLICGTVSLPDYSALFMNNTDLMMNTNHFCVSVLSVEGFNKTDKSGITYRYSYRFSDRSLTKKEKTELEEDAYRYLLSCQIQIQEMLNREQNQSISFLELDIGSDGPFMTVFVYMLVAMIAFIFAILTNNTIEHESVIIGTLLASGYKKSEIIWHYIQPTLIVAVIGSLIGNALGYTVMIQPFIDMYYSTYSIGPIDINFSVSAFLTTTILPVVIMVAINYWMLIRKLSLKPLNFLRRDLKKKKQRKAGKLPNVSFLNRFRLRVILQNKSSYIMLFI